MTTVSRAFVDGFARDIDRLNASAENMVARSLDDAAIGRRLLANDIGSEDYKAARAELFRFMHIYGDAYRRLASAQAVRFYNAIRRQSQANGDYEAEMELWYSYDEYNRAIGGIVADYKSGRTEGGLASALGGLLTRMNREAANDTVRINARKDPAKPRYCVVPGAGACVFCMLIAANGYTYPSDKGGQWHDHCNCQAVQVYEGQTVQGYDPENYAKQYEAARDALSDGSIPDFLKERIEREKERKGDDFDQTNAVLMVWRHQLENGE